MTFFIIRIQYLVETFSYQEVLQILPLLLEGDTRDQYGNLPQAIKQAINYNIARQEIELLAEYKPNLGKAYRKAKRLCFRFGNSNELPLKVYLRQKAVLIRDIGVYDYVAIIQETQIRLDLEIKIRLPIKQNETFQQFSKRCREVKTST